MELDSPRIHPPRSGATEAALRVLSEPTEAPICPRSPGPRGESAPAEARSVVLLSSQCLEQLFSRVLARKSNASLDIAAGTEHVDARNGHRSAVTEDASLWGTGDYAPLVFELLIEEEVGVRSTDDDSHKPFARPNDVRVV